MIFSHSCLLNSVLELDVEGGKENAFGILDIW